MSLLNIVLLEEHWYEQPATYNTSRHSVTVQLIMGSIVRRNKTEVWQFELHRGRSKQHNRFSFSTPGYAENKHVMITKTKTGN
jgi:hypothetical protein